jgi:hypothetical protein
MVSDSWRAVHPRHRHLRPAWHDAMRGTSRRSPAKKKWQEAMFFVDIS